MPTSRSRTRGDFVPNERLPGWLKTSSRVAAVLFLLNVFFVSIALMGAFKDIGSGYGQELMNNLAHNPFIGLVMGIFITSVIQSSSTTTSLVVGLVAGGAIGTTWVGRPNSSAHFPALSSMIFSTSSVSWSSFHFNTSPTS
jgi:hypothetical protein